MHKRQQTTPLPNKQPGKQGLKWRPCYRIVHVEFNRNYLHIEKQATGRTRPCNVMDIVHELPVKLWNVDATFGRTWKVYQSYRKSPHYPPKYKWK